jgi:hypothetical protein
VGRRYRSLLSFDEISMTFTEWQALSPEERAEARKTWNAYSDGYWHELNAEAVEHFKRQYGNRPEIRKVVGGTFHGGHLIIGVCENTPAGDILPLPNEYYGFRVVQLDS